MASADQPSPRSQGRARPCPLLSSLRSHARLRWPNRRPSSLWVTPIRTLIPTHSRRSRCLQHPCHRSRVRLRLLPPSISSTRLVLTRKISLRSRAASAAARARKVATANDLAVAARTPVSASRAASAKTKGTVAREDMDDTWASRSSAARKDSSSLRTRYRPCPSQRLVEVVVVARACRTAGTSWPRRRWTNRRKGSAESKTRKTKQKTGKIQQKHSMRDGPSFLGLCSPHQSFIGLRGALESRTQHQSSGNDFNDFRTFLFASFFLLVFIRSASHCLIFFFVSFYLCAFVSVLRICFEKKSGINWKQTL
jgi:hypothetical protein